MHPLLGPWKDTVHQICKYTSKPLGHDTETITNFKQTKWLFWSKSGTAFDAISSWFKISVKQWLGYPSLQWQNCPFHSWLENLVEIQLYKLGTTEVLSLPGFIKTPKNSSEEQANLEIKWTNLGQDLGYSIPVMWNLSSSTINMKTVNKQNAFIANIAKAMDTSTIRCKVKANDKVVQLSRIAQKGSLA